MDPQTTTYGDISPRTAVHAVARLLKRGQADLVTERFGQFDPQPKKSSKFRKWRRYNSLALATAPLAEGVTPTGQKLSFSDVTCQLEQYGDLLKLTDVIQDTHEDPVLQEMMDLCGEQIAETVETLRINVLKAGTNVFYANGVASRTAVAAAPSLADLRKIYRTFQRSRARKLSKIVAPTPNVATEPVAASYFAMGHTDLDADIRGITGFVPIEKYSNPSAALPGEIGKVENFRFILTSMFNPWLAAATDNASQTTMLTGGAAGTGSPDVYPLIFVASDAYAIVPLQGFDAVKPAVKNPGTVDKADPLGQWGFVSWKTWQAAVILNQPWLARLECCATANPSGS